jgi:nuclear cap-binding protein subunit 1
MQEDRQRADEERARRVRERIYKMGETDNGEDFFPQSDLFTIKKWIEEEGRKGNAQEQMILKAFRVMVTEQPHKTPLVAALLGFLIISPEGQRSSRADDGDNAMSGSSSDIPESLGVKIGKDLVKAFRSHLHSRLWRNVRLSVSGLASGGGIRRSSSLYLRRPSLPSLQLNFFASLAPLGIVSPSSMRTLLSAFSMVLNEPGVTVDRGDRAAMCIIEVLCRSGSDLIRPDLIPADSEADAVQIDDAALQEVNGMVEAVEAYAKGRRGESSLRRAWAPSTGEEADKDPLHEEGFEQAVEALLLLRSRQYRAPAFLPAATDLLPPAIVSISQDLLRGRGEMSPDQYQIALPEVLVPPEEDDSEGFSFGGDYLKDGKPSKSRGRKKGVTLEKADEEVRRAGSGPEKTAVFARWFVESTPLAGTPSAVVLRSLVNEVIDLYEVNRKECARILFGIAKWLRKGTFAGKAVSPDTGLFGDAEDLEWVMADTQDPQGGWTIDDVIVEVSNESLEERPATVPSDAPIVLCSAVYHVRLLASTSSSPRSSLLSLFAQRDHYPQPTNSGSRHWQNGSSHLRRVEDRPCLF